MNKWVHSTSARQREVLEQVASGKTNQEIADSLGISFESVKSHVSDILLRLDVSSREQAVEAWRADTTPVRTLRRTLSGVLATGFGRLTAATAGLALAGGAAFLVLIAIREDAAGDTGEPYLLRDGREVHQALAELSLQYGFPVIKPASDEFRITQVVYQSLKANLLLGGPKAVSMFLVDRSGTTFAVGQRNTEAKPGTDGAAPLLSETVIASRGDGVDVIRLEYATGPQYFAAGRSRSFLVRPLDPADDATCTRLLHALFDAAPDRLLDPGTPYPNPDYTRVTDPRQEEPYEFVDEFTKGTDFDMTGGQEEDGRSDASAAAGFDIQLPGHQPPGIGLLSIKIPAVNSKTTIRSAYLSLRYEPTGRTLVLVQHDTVLPPPTDPLAVPVATGQPKIEAWRIEGDIRDPETSTTLIARGNGRTAAILLLPKSIAWDEALPMLISVLQ